jgi:hypothetical protein
MRPDERRSWEAERVLDPDDEEQVRAWAARYQVGEDVIRDACRRVGPHRTAVELLLAAPPP